ncbi:alpha/beta fold hydrolase [Parvularcula oceani]|uniref:alpha/beta fold hydrolase n=1 Tax=Parvularcula oceani TaxID=1247963 RepID=UPI00068CC77A|nr:alpha/beta hydrolase [Parvularcula oceani]
MIRPILSAAFAVFVLGGASPAAAQDFEPCADAGSIPALAGSLCLREAVPLDPAHEDASRGEEITLFVRKFPAPDPAARRGEVWLVAGGPGETGASFYPVLPVLRAAFADYDLVIPDHRGTGYSAKLCPEQEAAESPAGLSLAGEEWGPCIGAMQGAAERARAFTITNAAHDLSGLIARHRQSGEVHLYGVSYGTQLVLRMMQAAPVPVDGIVLDGLVPPETDPRWDLSRRTEVVDAVGHDVLTPAQIDAYRALLADRTAGWRKVVPGGDLRAFMGRALNFPQLRERIPAVIEGLSRGDTAPLEAALGALEEAVADLRISAQSPPSLPLVMLISGSENNARPDLTAQMVEEEAVDALFTSPLPGLLTNNPAPLYERDGFFGGVPRNLPPTLIVHGTLDPNTPYEGARDHAAILSGAGNDIRFAAVEGGAHFLPLVAPDCFVRIVSAHLDEGQEAPARCRSARAP